MNDAETGTTATDLHDAIERALTALDTPTVRLHDGAVQRGRALRRRRRAATALAGVAAVAALMILVAPTVAGSRPAADSIAHQTGDDSPPIYEPPAGWWDMHGAQMRARLADLLPGDLTITATDVGDGDLAPGEKPHGGFLRVDVADADGPAGALNVLLYAPQPPENRSFVRLETTCPGNADVAPTRCTELHDASGHVVGRSARWNTGGVIVLEVTRLTPDGALVYAAASNSSDDKWGLGSSVDRSEAPVTSSTLRRIAADPAWQG